MLCRVPFTLMLTVLTLSLSVVPAIVVWNIFMDVMTSSEEQLGDTAQTSINNIAHGMQAKMISRATARLNTRVTEGENELLVQCSIIRASGLLNYNLRPSRFDIQGRILVPYQTRNFAFIKGHPYFTNMGWTAALWPNYSSTVLAARLMAQIWSAMYTDLAYNTLGKRTIYLTSGMMLPNEQWTVGYISYVDQTTGKVLALLQPPYNYSARYFDWYPTPSGWDTDLGFNMYTGSVQMGLWYWMPAKENTWVQVSISIDTQTISQELADELSGFPNDRLVIFFTQPHGHMIAASHGKFYSHSDVDRRYINPFTNPPNLTQYHLWTCLQSNDTLIPQACRQLHDQYQSWTAIPALQTEMILSGQRYWVAVDLTTTSLKCTVVMLKNRTEVMGSIDASSAQVDDDVASKKRVTFIVLGVAIAVAVVVPLVVGFWLAARLGRLGAGMDEIACLQFDVKSSSPTVFRELNRFQASFLQLDLALQAFAKFVPQAVVKVLIAGKVQATSCVSPEVLTVMFADIDGFSAVCEREAPAMLVSVCTEYFEAMCSSIVQRGGTIDKFVGDCIMAIWNAPELQVGHELDAVETSLAMQASVMHLHTTWQQRGLPILKFRLGIHTGVCLVGNFGCSHRISYTCLGDGVNFAARLEALNRKFGTTICVSYSTYQACRGKFHFRKLAKVAGPGKAEASPVFEALCPVVDDPLLSPSSEPSFSPLAELEEDVELISIEQVDCQPCGAMKKGQDSGVAQGPPKAAKESDNEVPYHWQYVNQTELLAQAAQYEAAYEAMVAGNPALARKVLSQSPTTIPDKAWQVLTDQLQHVAPTQKWDGVFQFCEK